MLVTPRHLKTAKIRRVDSTDKSKQVIDIFDHMCDTISDTDDSEP